MSSRRGVRRLSVQQLAAFADTTAEFGETELTRPWAEPLIAVGVAAVIAHFSEGGATVLAGAAAAALAAAGVDAVRRSGESDLHPGSEIVLGALVGLATAGAARMNPNPSDPTSRTSRAKMGSMAGNPAKITAKRSSEIAPKTIGLFQI